MAPSCGAIYDAAHSLASCRHRRRRRLVLCRRRALLGRLDVVQELRQGEAVALHLLRVQDGARPLLDDRTAASGSGPGPPSPETRRGCCPGSFLAFSSSVVPLMRSISILSFSQSLKFIFLSTRLYRKLEVARSRDSRNLLEYKFSPLRTRPRSQNIIFLTTDTKDTRPLCPLKNSSVPSVLC